MLEVVFGESLAGAMMQAKGRRAGQRTVAPCVTLFVERNDGEEADRYWSEPGTVETVWSADLPGTAADVAPLVLALDRGDLSELDTAEMPGRKALLIGLQSPVPPAYRQSLEEGLAKQWHK